MSANPPPPVPTIQSDDAELSPSLPPVMRSLSAKDAAAHPGAAQAVDRARMDLHAMQHGRQAGRGDRGDVLAFVQFPDTRALACDGTPWESFRLRLDSAKLLATGSSVIQTMLSAPRQTKYRAQLGAEDLPAGVAYVVDFTPPLEGVELAEMTAALWLPRMVKLWFLAGLYVPNQKMNGAPGDKAPVSALMCLGHDDLCRNLRNNCWSEIELWKPDTSVKGVYESEMAGFRDIPPYCRVRHCAAIVRLLLAINGDAYDRFPLINSAARMWTMAQVAIRLDLGALIVDPVSSWLMAPPNTKFLEICPERAYQLALDLQIPDVLIAAFKMLVSERAVDLASPIRTPRVPPRTWAGRQRDDYGDLPTDAIEYAAEALAARVRDEMAWLRSAQGLEILLSRLRPDPSSMWSCLTQARRALSRVLASSPPTTAHAPGPESLVAVAGRWFEAFMDALRNLVRGWVDSGFNNPEWGTLVISIGAEQEHYIPDSRRSSIDEVYMALHDSQKALTRLWWRNLWSASRNAPPPQASVTLTSLAAAIRKAMDSDEVPQPEAEPLERFLRTFDMDPFLSELRHVTANLYREMVGDELSDTSANKPFTFSLSSHLLLHLTANELRYLPLWAGGDDDGTGGVFQPAIPPAEMGPVAPGPGYHTGYSVAAASTAAHTMTTAMDVEDSAVDTTVMSASSVSGINTPTGTSVVPTEFVAGHAPSSHSELGSLVHGIQHMALGNTMPTTATASLSGVVRSESADTTDNPAFPSSRNRSLSIAESESARTERNAAGGSGHGHGGGVDPFGLEVSDDEEDIEINYEDDDDDEEDDDDDDDQEQSADE